MILFKNSKNPIHIMSEKQRIAEIEKFQDQRETNICRHIGLYDKPVREPTVSIVG